MGCLPRFVHTLHLLLAGYSVLSHGQTLCPEAVQCYCFFSGNEIRADCIGPEITVISADLPWNLTELYVSYSSMQTLQSGNLSLYGHLTQVELIENTLLTTIERGAFSGLNSMESLIVIHNAIDSIPTDTLPKTLVSLYLQNNQLTTIPSMEGLTELELLNLDNNRIGEIPGNTFRSNSKLKEIYMSYNRVQSIATDAFDRLSDVESLFLDSNELASVESGDFTGLSALRTLSLTHNLLTQLTDGAFTGIGTTTLTQLHLSSNQIASIQSKTFSSFSNLTSLYLTNNKLTSVPSAAIQGTVRLELLDLSSNLFQTIEENAFSGLLSLSSLTISDMESLVSLSTQAFVGIPSLTVFTLSGNRQLTELTPEQLPDSHFQALQELRIYGNGFTSLQEQLFATKASLQRVQLFDNPLYCDCKLAWMPRVIAEDVVWAREWVGGNQILCHSPRHLEAFNIPTMKVKDFVCDLPAIDPDYSGDQQKVVAFLHGNATLQATGSSGIPRSWWVSPSGGEFVPLRTVPTARRLTQDIDAFENYDKTTDETLVIATLIFKNTTQSDGGVYKVWASNHLGNVSANVELEVLPYEQTPAPLPTTQVVGRADWRTGGLLQTLITAVVVWAMDV